MGTFSVDLSGKAALVTGAGEGIARATALALARSGAAVCVNDLNPDRADAVVEEIERNGGRAFAWVADVSNRFQAAATIETLRDHFGGLHIVVNGAGTERPTPFLKIDEYDWRRVLEINLTGAFFCTQLASRVMADEGGGVVVNIASPAGYARAHPDGAVYAASKAAVSSFTETLQNQFLADELKLRASVFYPSGGMLRTNLWVADQVRPAELAREVPRLTPAITVEILEEQARQKGYELPWQDLNELARVVIQGIRDERFVIMIGADAVGPQLAARAEALGRGECPPHSANPML